MHGLRLPGWWAALGGVLACTTGVEQGASAPRPALRGADISALERLESAGAVFRDHGAPGDAIAILRSHGANLFRLRLFLQPDGSEVQVNDLEYTVRLAQRVKASGAGLLLDLHYSDTWADPAHQTTPAAWDTLDLAGLELAVEAYTADVLARFRAAGCAPDIVQVGNEVDDGMLWPLGRLSGAPDTTTGWDQFTRLLQAGIRGVHAGGGAGDSTRVLIHFSQGGSAAATQWFFDHLVARGVPFDLIGLSYYPWWHGTIGELRANLGATAGRYGRGILVVETAYPWRAGGWEGIVPDATTLGWPVTRGGQARFLRDLMEAVGSVSAGRGVGVLWWYPEAVPATGLYVWGNGSLALFDGEGRALPATAALAPP
ncbi:MAG: glycosyl hydrolase 53 family protein [Gemmatimonadetes bacterium]|nr:glycosyl hydrolase 53 family protein [Gemmatimonadota bacterium]